MSNHYLDAPMIISLREIIGVIDTINLSLTSFG